MQIAMTLADTAAVTPRLEKVPRRSVARARPSDWLVEMDRFDQEGLFDRLAARGSLSLDVMRPLATAIARFPSRVNLMDR
jgi:aminoglycoside phosphotransferase family enzyme